MAASAKSSPKHSKGGRKMNLTKMEQLEQQMEKLKEEVAKAKNRIKDMSVYDVLSNCHELCIHDVEYRFLNKAHSNSDREFSKTPSITLLLNFEDGSYLNLNVSLKDAYIG